MLEKDVKYYREELEKVHLAREIETRIYKEKLCDLIDAYNEAGSKANESITNLQLEVDALSAELKVKQFGFFPGNVNDPYIDVASLVEFPTPLKEDGDKYNSTNEDL